MIEKRKKSIDNTTSPRVRSVLSMKALSLLAAAALGAPSAHAQLYLPGVTLITGNIPSYVAQGDLNGDGVLDLAVTNWGANSVSVYLGVGNGTFSTAQTSLTGSHPWLVSLADLNHDAKLDMVVSNRGQGPTRSNTISLYLGNGNGTFAPQQVVTTGFGPSGVAISDLNADGNLDLAVTATNSNSVSILLGVGDGTFLPFQSAPTPITPLSVAVGDMNADGKLDLAIANLSANVISLLFGNGDGTFAPFQTIALAPGTLPFDLGLADFDADGKLDLVTADFGANTVSIRRGIGNGTFALPSAFPAGSLPFVGAPQSITIGDVNNDGALDVAVANVFDDYVSVLLGTGAATFAPTQSFQLLSGSGPVSIALGDYDRDGDLEMAVVKQGTNFVSIMVNQTTIPGGNPADLTGDGIVNAADLAFLLANWGP